MQEELKNIPCYKIACVCIASLHKLYDNNLNREKKVPIAVISKHLKSFECPQYFEGFDDIIFKFNKEDYGFRSIDSILEIDCNCPHDNPHHTLNIKDHMLAAEKEARKRYSHDDLLIVAAKYHDIGKYYCKNFKEVNNNYVATYYGHQNVSAYYLLCALCRAMQSFNAEEIWTIFNSSSRDFLKLVFLVNYHMVFFTESEKKLKKFKELVSEELFKELEKLHECDIAAH